MMKAAVVHLIAGARPNFMKIAPLYHALAAEPWCRNPIIHTGQHYDAEMSDAFFRDLGLPPPDEHLNVGSGTHAEQTAAVMLAYERLCLARRPDWAIVVGDVNSTMACALTASKLHVPVAHLEAGLRSGDRTMPEEINRLVTDAVADLLWTPSADADRNLLAEGVLRNRIERVGNIMIDSYEMLRERIEATGASARFGLDPGRYGVVTLHRPSNVDTARELTAIVEVLRAIADKVPLIFPLHPRTRGRLVAFKLMDRLASNPAIRATEPLSYIPFMSLVRDARLVLTDSGGVQEETTYLGIPCLTLRDTTERPITIEEGTNCLVRLDEVGPAVDRILRGDWPPGRRPPLWDGQTAGRVAASLKARIDG